MYGSQSERTNLLSDFDNVEAIPYRQNSSVIKAREDKAKSIRFFIRNSVVAIVSISFIALLLVGFNFSSSTTTSHGKETLSLKSLKVETTMTVTPSILTMTASNEYGVFLGPYPWMTQIVGTQLVEPFKNTTLSLSGSSVASGLYIFTWDITGFESEYTAISLGELAIVFQDPKIYNITITAYLASDKNCTGTAQYTYSTRLVWK